MDNITWQLRPSNGVTDYDRWMRGFWGASELAMWCFNHGLDGRAAYNQAARMLVRLNAYGLNLDRENEMMDQLFDIYIEPLDKNKSMV